MNVDELDLDAVVVGDWPLGDVILINGEVSPGKATIISANSPRSWDERKGFGLSGAVLFPAGDELAKFEVLFEFWDPAQIDEWYAFASKFFDRAVKLLPTSNTIPRQAFALSIYHPILFAPPLRITSCVPENISMLEQDEFGGWSCVVSFIQYRQPVLALPKPKPALQARATTDVTVPTKAQAELADKQAEFKSLGAQYANTNP